MLGDGERGAMIGPDGQAAWLCAPQWHSAPVFDGLLGGQSYFRVGPTDRWSVWSGSYRPGSLIWCAQWVTRDAIVHGRDALALPADPHTAVLLRRTSSTDRPAEIEMSLVLPAGAARRLHRTSGGGWECDDDGIFLRLSGARSATVETGERPGLRMVHTVAAGEDHDLVLELSDRPFDSPPPDAQALWRRTEQTWRDWTPDAEDTLAPRDVQHAYAVLRGLTSSSGGMVAAATTALPEQARAGANYDYRYAWIRDQCWVGQAVAAHRDDPLLHKAVDFVTERLLADGDKLAPAYTVDGGRVPDEDTLGLVGYPGGSDRIGNRVTSQFQLDVFGEALLLFAAAARHRPLSADTWRAVVTAVDAIQARGGEPDAGIWELDNRKWTHSRLACVAGLRAIRAHAPAQQRADWAVLAERILADTRQWAMHPTGRWQRAADDPRVDAALLQVALRGAIPADDPCSVATHRAIRTELTRDGYVYRYRHRGHDLGDAEGAFLVCGFLMALAEHQQGNQQDALRWFERNRSACGPPGLFAEEYDVRRRQLRGNLPQAFVHGLLIESATTLASPRR